MLKNASEHKNVSADGTYKIMWQGFPLIVVGAIDRQKHFHVTAIVVTSNERKAEYEFVFRSLKEGVEKQSKCAFTPEALISDYAMAIRSAFFSVFGQTQNIICSVHLFRKLKERGGFLHKENKKALINDICILHSAPDAETFDHSVLLFLEKWENVEQDFCTYFKATWLG